MSKPMSPIAKAAIAGGIIGGIATAIYVLYGKSDAGKDDETPTPSGEAGGGERTTTPGGDGGGSGGDGGGSGGDGGGSGDGGMWGSTSNWGSWTNAMGGGMPSLGSVSSVWVSAPPDAVQGMAIAMPYYTDASLTVSDEPYDSGTMQRLAEIGRFIKEHGASHVITDADIAIFWLSHDDVINWYFKDNYVAQMNDIRSGLPDKTVMVVVLDRPPGAALYAFRDKFEQQVPGPWQLVEMPIDASRDAGSRLVARLAGASTPGPSWSPPAQEKPKPWYWPF